ncbi:hypothetical protein BDW66DRAFT_154782 [Aspergillus desertorum]
MRPSTPSTTADAAVHSSTTFNDILDDPFFSGTSFPSPGIASPVPEPAASRDARTWESTPIEIPNLYTAADQFIDMTCTSTASSTSSSATIPFPASQEQPTARPISNSPSTRSGDRESAQDKSAPEDMETEKPDLNITIPTWTDSSPMERTPTATTLRSVNVRSSPYPHPHPHPLASRRSHAVPPLYSAREELLIHELQIARREICDLRAGLVKYQNNLVGAQRKINLLTETMHREREAFAIARDWIRELEYTAALLGDGSARR